MEKILSIPEWSLKEPTSFLFPFNLNSFMDSSVLPDAKMPLLLTAMHFTLPECESFVKLSENFNFLGKKMQVKINNQLMMFNMNYDKCYLYIPVRHSVSRNIQILGESKIHRLLPFRYLFCLDPSTLFLRMLCT